MVNISRVRAVWSGFVGGPGISTFYFTDTITAVPSVHAFFAGIRTWLPQDVHIQVENAGDILNNETGALIDSWVEDAVEVVVGDNDAAYSAPAGAVVDWLTSRWDLTVGSGGGRSSCRCRVRGTRMTAPWPPTRGPRSKLLRTLW